MPHHRTRPLTAAATRDAAGCTNGKPAMPDDTVFELRDYTLHPGQREVLIALFESTLIASQNALGAHVRGIFYDIDRPDHFVWMRGFTSMAARLSALRQFYAGPVWQANRAAANATMIDSDDVHLLRLAHGQGLRGATIQGAFIAVDILPDLSDAELAAALAPRSDIIAAFKTHTEENSLPQLPVHSKKVVIVMRVSASFGHPALISGLPAPLRTLRLRPAGCSPLTLASPLQTPQDFDFLAGQWHVHNRKLRVRNRGSNDWEAFPATNRLWTLLDGVVNVDEYHAPAKGFKGMTVRALDLSTGVWSIYWIDSRGGVLLPPVRGGFVGAVGEFVGADTDGPSAILCRFRWQRNPHSPSWEQAFSYDSGATWETNWTMDFTRAEAPFPPS